MKNKEIYNIFVNSFKEITGQNMSQMDSMSLENSLSASVNSAVIRFNGIGAKKLNKTVSVAVSSIATSCRSVSILSSLLSSGNKVFAVNKKDSEQAFQLTYSNGSFFWKGKVFATATVEKYLNSKDFSFYQISSK